MTHTHSDKHPHAQKHTRSLVKPRLIILPGQISFCVETHEVRAHTLLLASPVCIRPPHCCLGLPGKPIFISTSVEKTHRCVCDKHTHTPTHTQDHVYIDLEQSPGAVQYTSSSSPSLSQSRAFSFSLILIEMKLLGLKTGREEECFLKITSSSAQTLLPCRLLCG